MSQSQAPAASSPAGMDPGVSSCLTVQPGMTALLDSCDIDQAANLELRTSAGYAQPQTISLFRPDPPRRRTRQEDIEFILRPRQLTTRDIALLPGGAVTIRGPDAILVCDPAEAISFNATEAHRLHRGLAARVDVSTLSHTAKGIVLSARVPKLLPPQAVTIAPDATKSPIRTPFTGPVLIQWGIRGAVAWPLVTAPAAFAVAASIAASPLVRSGSGLINSISAIASDSWYAEDAEARSRLIAPALAEHLNDTLAASDPRLDLMAAFMEGSDGLVRRIGEMLGMLPSCFLPDPAAIPGAPPAAWRHGIAHIFNAADNLALLGLDRMLAPIATIHALRDLIDDAELLAFDDDGAPLPGSPTPLRSDTAMLLARNIAAHGRLGLAIPTPASPVDLYALAHDAAGVTGSQITAIAPCWGFCHRIDTDGEECGNAGWFGMGAGLDEMDVPLADFEHRT
jgi:hypothetical protein